MNSEDLLQAMKQFEKRNNISTYIVLCSDGSLSIHEFWKEETLSEISTIEEAKIFLETTEYELDENGLCFSPVKLKIK
jgi:hypothetical protein